MARLIQSNQLSPIQGSAGQQTVVQDNGPTLGEGLQSAVQNIGGMIDTAGNIYGKNRAQSVVNEELENIDRARDVAESGQFTAGDAVPESLKLDQKEWDMLATAVQSGTMSREKARLLASSRLRTRISEEPFFADRMRKAASGLVGFNIESEGAQQYFASFPTAASLGSGGNDYLSKIAEQADAWVKLGVVEDRQAAMQWLAKRDRAEAQSEMAKFQAEAGVRTANDMANVLLTEHNSVAWGGLIGDVKATFQEGGPVTPETFNRVLTTQKQEFKEVFDKSWINAGGDLNSEDYNRHLSRLNNEYDQMGEFVNEYGIDNIMKLRIDRQEQMFDLLGMEMFPQLTMITRTFGQQVASDLINMSAMNPTRRATLMANSPELKAAFNLMDQDEKQFTKKMMDVSTKLLNGETIDEIDAPFLNHVAKDLHKNGTPETKEGVVRGLADQGLDWKGLSLIANSRAYLEPKFNKDTFKRQYEQGMPAAVNQLAIELTQTPGIVAEVDSSGNVVVSQDIAGGAMAQTGTGGLVTNPQETQAQIVAMNRAKQLADKINLFTKGMSRGFDQVVGKSRDQHTIDLRNMLNESKTNIQEGRTQQAISKFNETVASGDLDAARQEFERLQQLSPVYADRTWDDVMAQALEMAEQEMMGEQ